MLAHQINDNTRTKDVLIVEDVTFDSLLLSKNVLNGLLKSGFKKPSPVQLKSIPVGRCGFDLIVKSKSGTGKTLVFSIIALESLKLKKDKLEVLILSPTREIAIQSQEVIKQIGCFFEGLKVESFIGGLSLNDDKEKCKKCHIAVGTPGRIKQLINEKHLKTDSVRLFILDEADKLMEDSFRNDINEIYNSLPVKKQIITTSATYPNQLDQFLSKYMLSPTHINAEIDTPLLLGLKQFVITVKPTATVVQLMKLKTEELVNILTNIGFTQCLVFTNYQSRAESISNILNQKGWPSTYISAAQTQEQRLLAVNQLKDFKCRIMLSTDLTARGIDAANVDLVINYDIPNDPMTYLHRMGRAGRYGSTGACINLVSENSDLLNFQRILGYIGGAALSVPKLSKFNGSVAELLNLEIPVDEYVKGIANAENKDPVAPVGHNKVYEIIKKDSDNVNVLNESKNEAVGLEKQLSDMNTDEILSSLINENFKMPLSTEMKEKKDIDVNSILDILSDNKSSNKTKSKNVKESKLINVDFNKEVDIVAKNKALLDTTKILSGASTTEDTIEQHLSNFKSKDKEAINDLLEKNPSDLLNLLVNNERPQPQESEFNINQLFKWGYKNIVKTSNPNWRDILSKEITGIELKDVDEEASYNSSESEDSNIYKTKGRKNKKSIDSHDSRVPSSEDCGEAAAVSNYKTRRSKKKRSNVPEVDTSAEVDIMKWIPVETPTKSDKRVNLLEDEAGDVANDADDYTSYFDECSNNLWQNGLSFDSVEAFDEWFYYEWESQLYSVRNYVQQNVYVNEMAKYQHFTRSNK